MKDQWPRFNSENPLDYHINDFIQAIETKFATKGTPLINKKNIIISLLRRKAEDYYNDRANHGWAPPAAAAAPEPDRAANLAAHEAWLLANYNYLIKWLKATFHGQEEQRIIRSSMNNMKQAARESPMAFASRVGKEVAKAGIPAGAATEILKEQIWEKGLHPLVKRHIDENLVDDFPNKIRLANNFWKVHFQTQSYESVYLEYDPFEEDYDEPRSSRKTRRVSYNRNDSVDKPEPRKRDWQKKVTEDDMDKLVKQVAEMKILLMDQQKVINEDKPKRIFPRKNTQYNGEPRIGRCRRCGETGHYAQDCRSEKILTREQRDQLFQDDKKRGVYSLQEFKEHDSDEDGHWEEDFEDSEEEEDPGRSEDEGVYPVQRTEKSTKEKPYTKKILKNKGKEPEIQILKNPKAAAGSSNKKPPAKQSTLNVHNPTLEIHLPGNDTSVAEDLKNKKKRRVTESTVIEKIEKDKVKLTMEELMKVSPQHRNI